MCDFYFNGSQIVFRKSIFNINTHIYKYNYILQLELMIMHGLVNIMNLQQIFWPHLQLLKIQNKPLLHVYFYIECM